MKNLRQLFRRSAPLASDTRRRRQEKSRRTDVTRRSLTNEILEKRELLAGDFAAHNYWNRYDVNDDGRISASDAVGVINRIGISGESEHVAADGPQVFADVNADGLITASDALGVINAMSRGEEVGELVELLITARDLNDQEIPADSNGDINVEVGQLFDIEISYDDLRLFNERLGVFQLFTDITVSQAGVLSPVLNETQRLIIDETITSVPSTGLTFSIPEAPPGISGGALTYESSINDFGNNALGEVRNALNAFGYTSSQFTVGSLDFGNNDLGFQIHWVGDEFGNLNLPNIDVEVNETNPSDDIPTQTVEFAPFLADGVTPNSDAVRFNINTFSRTFNDNEEFYSAQNRGAFDSAIGFTGVGGLGMVPLEGGGIPQLTDDGGFIEPFDAFSLRVFLNQEVTDLVVGVNPGEDPEATLLYGRDEAVPQDMVLIRPENANITINSTDGVQAGTIRISPGAVSVDEGAGTITLMVNREGGSSGAVSVDFTTANGTAEAGSDYTLTSGTVNFADGDTAPKSIVVPITDDTAVESNETFTVTLSNLTGGATLGTNVSTVTILDNDSVAQPGVFSIDPAAVSVDEGGGSVTLTVNRTGGSNGAVSVAFTTANGTATAGSDYTANSGTLNFANGQTSQTITVQITDDTAVESSETFTVNLSSPTGGATIGSPSSSTVTITDNDSAQPGVFTITPATTSVNEGAGSVTLTVNRTGGSSGTVSVSFATTNGTATAPADYTATSGNLIFADGETSKTVTVPIIDDTLDESNETFTVDLTSATGAPIGTPNSSTVTIIDNDGVAQPGTLSLPATLSVNENAGTATLTVTRTGGSDGPVSVNFATANGTATAGSDYTSTSGTLNFADGQTSASISVPIIDDTAVENSETFTVTLSGPTGGASLGTATSTVTILDNDVSNSGVLSIAPATISVAENGGTVSLTVSRTGGSSGSVSVAFATSNGTAIAGSDYDANSGTLSFADGETSKTITVGIRDDSIDEPDETFRVTLSNPTGGATLGSVTSSTVTILDNDLPGPGNASIAGSVFIDEMTNALEVALNGAQPDRNGRKDFNESGLGGVSVRLDGQGLSLTAITDIRGAYRFEGLVGGTYNVTLQVDPSTVLVAPSFSSTLFVGVSGNSASVTGQDFPLLNTAGSALSTVDILASSYLGSNGDIASESNHGREGGLVSLDASGNLNFIVIGDGFDGVSFAELVLNSERDAALLTVIEEGGGIRSALLSQDHFVLSGDGAGVQFFGGRDDFDFFDTDDDLGNEFVNFRNAIDKVLGQN